MLRVKGESGEWETAALIHVRDPESNEEIHCLVAPFSAMPSTAISALSHLSIICPRVSREAPLRPQWVRRPWSDAGRGITIVELNAEGAYSLIWWGATSYEVIREIEENSTSIFDWSKQDREPAIMEALEEQTVRIRGQVEAQSNAWFGNSAGQLVAFLPNNSKKDRAIRLDAIVHDLLHDRAHQLK